MRRRTLGKPAHPKSLPKEAAAFLQLKDYENQKGGEKDKAKPTEPARKRNLSGQVKQNGQCSSREETK